ncbi:TonB-dependent receptor [Balneola sp. MJW-20]|uniref:TonB-dependent receptor n=1 Tax=Gracilimonas aurantiaca TaxID=3234185 RepID=UPI003464F0B0
MPKSGLLLLLLSLLPAFLQAQSTASISGYVRDAETGETLISANVALQELNKGASTNTLGYYTITNIPAGRYKLLATYIGFRLSSQEITLEAGEKLRLDIDLVPESVQLEEVIVESDSDKEEQKNIGTIQVKTELINELPSVFEADVFRSIQLLPGVKAASDFSSGLYVRGGSPDQTLILLDRTTVYNPSHFFGFFSTFNPDAIKDVRLYKGGYPAEYGGRLGSVLAIYNKDGNRNEFGGSATVGLLASRILLEGPYSRGSWMLAVRRSTLEPLLAGLRQSIDSVPSLFYFLDVNGKVNFDAGENDKLSLAFYSGKDRVNFPFVDDAEFQLDYGNQTLSTNWTHIFSEKLFSNFVFTGSRYFNFPTFELATTQFERDNNIYDYSVKGDLEYLPNDRHQISTGFWAGALTLRLQDRFDGQDTFRSRIHNRYASVYVQDEWRPTQKWKITPGIRMNYFSDGSYFRAEPRVSVEYRASDRLRLQTAYGRYNQFLTLISNEAFSGFDVWLTSDQGVRPAYGDQFIVGAKTIPFKDYGFDVELYYRTMNDLFELDPFLPDAAGFLYADLFRVGEGYAYGAEFFFEKRVGRLTGFIGYTLGYTWRKFPSFNLELQGDNQTARFYPPKYDRRNDINLVGTYRLSRKWKFTASFNYATGQAYTKALGRYELQDFPFNNDDINVFTVGKVNASRLPDYHRLDISFSRTGTFFGIGEAEWQFQLINVYSRRNVWFYNFDFDENPVKRSEVPLLPILPSLSYTVDF